jgi:type IV secretory pathway VirB10-like protein
MTGTGANDSGSADSTRPKTSEEIARSLRLRPELPRVTRLSRKVVAGGTALAVVLVSGAVLWALQNNRTRRQASEELYSTDHHNVADGLAGLPRDYTGIPRDVQRLGPPLPGDLYMRDVSTKQAALTVIGMTVVLAVVLYLATLFTA